MGSLLTWAAGSINFTDQGDLSAACASADSFVATALAFDIHSHGSSFGARAGLARRRGTNVT
jgi:hypothetical protein